MLSGAVLGRRWQPFESHIPFLLQLKVGLEPPPPPHRHPCWHGRRGVSETAAHGFRRPGWILHLNLPRSPPPPRTCHAASTSRRPARWPPSTALPAPPGCSWCCRQGRCCWQSAGSRLGLARHPLLAPRHAVGTGRTSGCRGRRGRPAARRLRAAAALGSARCSGACGPCLAG